MPRFANGESGRKSQSDTIQKMKRQLATAISRHATLQHENQQLHQEHQLLQAVCGALGVELQEQGAALLLSKTVAMYNLLHATSPANFLAQKACSAAARRPHLPLLPLHTIPLALTAAPANTPAYRLLTQIGCDSKQGRMKSL